MPDDFESVQSSLNETVDFGDEFSLDDLDRLFSDSTEDTSEETVVEEPAAPVVNSTPAPVATPPSQDHRLPPGVVPVSVVQAEREAKRKALEAEAKLREEFEAFKQQVSNTTPQPTSQNEDEIPDERTDPFGALKYRMEQELRRRDQQMEEMRYQYDNYLAATQQQAESVKVQTQEIDLRRTVGDADYQEKLNAFNDFLNNSPEGQLIPRDSIWRTPNPAWTAYELGRRHLAAQQVLNPQPQYTAPAPVPNSPAPQPAVPGLPANFNVDAFKQQVIEQATAAAYAKEKNITPRDCGKEG